MKNADKPAHPVNLETNEGYPEYMAGMTKREAFALAAMQGILSGRANEDGYNYEEVLVAQWAIRQADALLSALEETPKP